MGGLGLAGVAGWAGSAGLLAQSGPTSTTTTVAGSSGCTISPGGYSVSGLCLADNSLHISIAYRSILPVLVLTIGTLVLLAVSAILPKRAWPGLYSGLTALIGLCALGTAIWQWYDLGSSRGEVTIGTQVFYDHFSVLFMMLVAIAVILGALAADSYLRREGLDGVEAYVLILMSGTGAMLMALSGGLIMLFLGLEIMSISLYVLAAYHRRRTQSGEAGLKYFILGSFSSAIFLYGVALVYGATGSTQFVFIAGFLSQNTLTSNAILLAGMALLIVGLGFKVAAVPFHFWTPDVYQGAPTPFTGYMAAVAKAAGFAGLIRVLNQAFSSEQANWRPAIWLIAVLTLAVGSVLALAQKDMKRMFAYSSISQAGYVLVGVQAASTTGTSAALFYLFTYTFIIIGTFAIVALIQGPGEARNDLGAIRGLARRQPALALVMLVFLLAQAGVPLTTGFLAKFYVIQAAVQRGQYSLAIIAMLAAAVAAFFYLRVALLMYATDEEAQPAPAPAQEAGVGTAPAGSAGGTAEGPSAPVSVGAGAPSASVGAGAPSASVGAGNPPSSAPVPTASAGSPTSGTTSLTGPATNGGWNAEEDPIVAGLEPVRSLDGPNATATLLPPPPERIRVPPTAIAVLAICAAFTIVAGVIPLVIDFAREATTLF